MVIPRSLPGHHDVADRTGWERVQVEVKVPPLESAAGVDPRRTVVFVVDMQNNSFHPDSPEYSGPEGPEAIEATAALLPVARRAGCEVIWVRSVRSPDQPEFTHFGLKPYRTETWATEIMEPLKPEADEFVFDKYTHNILINTPFEAYLTEKGITAPEWTFIVVGGSFAGCVHHALTSLSMLSYAVLVPMDCVTPRTGDKVAIAKSRLGFRYSHNVTMLNSWRGIAFDASIETDARRIPVHR